MGQTTAEQQEHLKRLPQVDRLSTALSPDGSHALRVAAAREAVAQATERIMQGEPAPSFEDLLRAARKVRSAQDRRRLQPVINATGVLLHTNLGRAPLSDEAMRAVRRTAGGYSNLEFDLAARRRGSRYSHSAESLIRLTGAESALVVNNNAAAVLLALAGLSRDREAIISRGELIEIGGEFRIPDIMAESGARMREVGTTNRTHLMDYAEALTEETGAILKIHPSNYQVTGFTASVPGRELAHLAHTRGIPLIHDVGSGLLDRQAVGDPSWLGQEPSVAEALRDGADVVTFSGDKLLGGPQAGILVGKSEAIDRLRSSPLLRAFRTDKTTLAALEATLQEYVAGDPDQIPLWRMALQDPVSVRERAESVAAALPAGAPLSIQEGFSTTGGGSAPSSRIPTFLIAVRPPQGAQALAASLLEGDPPIVGRVANDLLLLDLRTVDPGDDASVSEELARLLHPA